MFRTRFSVSDGFVMLTVLFLAILLFLLPFLWKKPGKTLTISTPNGSQSYSLAADRDVPVSSNGITLTVEIRDGRARVRESSCPDGICVSSGWIDSSGQTVICAPAAVRLLITNTEGGAADVDFIAG